MTWAAGYAGALYAPVGATGSLLLDGITATVKGAYSLRRLRTAYAGSSLRVRRSSDGTEQDIGFDGTGSLDIAALPAFCGSGDGFLSKWYDQSGLGQDMAQATVAAQPRIVLAGAVRVFGNVAARPAVEFVLGLKHNMLVASFATGSPASYAAMSVGTRTGSTSGPRFISFKATADSVDYSSSTSVIFGYFSGSALTGYQPPGGAKSNVAVSAAPFQSASVWNGTSHLMTIDGTAGSAAAGVGTLAASGSLFLGAYGASTPASDYADGRMAEHIVTTGTLSSADQATIRTSQRTYYGTP